MNKVEVEIYFLPSITELDGRRNRVNMRVSVSTQILQREAQQYDTHSSLSIFLKEKNKL